MRLIDADALIDWMDREQVLRHITWFRAVIDNMPTIDPVKHGRWVLENGCVRCSECGEPNMEWNYCPNCGADMRGEEDE